MQFILDCTPGMLSKTEMKLFLISALKQDSLRKREPHVISSTALKKLIASAPNWLVPDLCCEYRTLPLLLGPPTAICPSGLQETFLFWIEAGAASSEAGTTKGLSLCFLKAFRIKNRAEFRVPESPPSTRQPD